MIVLVRLAGAESPLLSTVQMLSGAIYVAMQFSAVAILVALLALAFDSGKIGVGDMAGIRPMLVLGDTIIVVFVLRAAAVFMLSGTTRALRSGLFPAGSW